MATTGTSGKDTLSGGTGDDTLRGFLGDDTYTYHLGNGADTVIDTGGSDTLLLGDPMGVYSGMDVYRSTSGTDLVFDFGSAGKVILQKQFSTTATTPATRIEFLSLEDEPGMKLVLANGLKGTNKSDLIVGKATADNIAGGAGNDWIFGGAGNDTLSGGDGDDELHGGAGNDQLDGGLGDDYFESGAGNDKVNGGDGHDEITYVGQGDGIFVNMTGAMQAFNGKQVDNGKVYEKATSTFDTLNSIESLGGTSHADVVAFGQFNATSNLSVSLGQGNDTVTGTLAGANSYGSIHVGYWDDPNGVIVNLSDAAIEVKLGDALHTVAARSARDGWGDTDTFQFSGQQHISIGDSDHDDYIRGQDATGPNMSWEWFNTGRGNDTIDGGTGPGVDTMSYSAWDDSNFGAIVNLSQNSITVGGVTVQAGTARDNWGYTDTLLNIEGINGSSMNDYVLGSAADNNLMGGTGKDTLLGADGNDFMDGGDGNDSLLGGNGVDYVSGGEGNDTLAGGDGTDNMQGGNGDDLLIGGAGTDNMDGGAGRDVFKYNSLADLTSGSDGFATIKVITNFVHGEDHIDLSAIDANPNMAGKQAFTFLDAMPATFVPGQIWLMGNSLMINMNKDFAAEYQLLVLQPPGQAPLSASDFIFV